MGRKKKKLEAHPAAEKPKPPDSLCNHCGKCCYKKIIVGRTVYITPFPCEFLDTHTNMCTVYERRHEMNPDCLSMETGFKHSAFPSDCPYVPEMAPPKYKPAREDYDWADEWDDFDNLADDLDVSAQVRGTVRARGPNARPMHVEAFERLQESGVCAQSLADLVRGIKT